jgi:hypothetical protein
VQGDSGRGLAGPGEEELEVIEVMDGGSGVKASAAQPPFESFGVGEHKSTSCGQDMDQEPRSDSKSMLPTRGQSIKKSCACFTQPKL